MCSSFALCVKSSSHSLNQDFSPHLIQLVQTHPNLPEPLTRATSKIWFHIRTATFQFWPLNATEAHFTSLCRKQKEKPLISPLRRKISATHKHLPVLYSFAAGLGVITMSCCITNGSSLWDRLCRPRRQKSLLLVALWIPSWWLTQPPALHSCSPAVRALPWKLILETLLRFKIKPQQLAVQSHWETPFDLMVICYIHFSSTGSLKWWSLFCQQRGRRQ